jgi:Tfp pilus assembly pilus retraction ATPase PilT
MPELQWDHLMETCLKQAADAVLIQGAPPLLRVQWGFRESLLPPLSADEIEALVAQVAPPLDKQEAIAGCFRIFDLRYGSESRFRLAVFARGLRPWVVLTRLPSRPLPPLACAGRQWRAAGPPFSLDRLLMNCAKGPVRDAILIAGCPPLAWSPLGVHAFLVPPLTPADVASMHAELLRTAGPAETHNGYSTVDVAFRTDTTFRIAAFSSSPVLLLKLPQTS